MAAHDARSTGTMSPTQAQGTPIGPLTAEAMASRAEAVAAFGRNDNEGAGQALVMLARSAPDHPETARLQALLACRRGDFIAAIALLRAALGRRPQQTSLLINLAEALAATGAFAEAATIRRRLTTLSPSDAGAWLELGRAHQADSDPEAACAAYERSTALDPGILSTRILLAHALLACGRAVQAEQQFRDVLQCAPDHAPAWFGLVCVLGIRLDDGELQLLRDAHDATAAASDERIFAGFALARALETSNAHATAFSILSSANADRRRHLAWDAAKFSQHIDALANTFSAALAQADDDSLGTGVIFIVGMPRSGSTLAEQILSTHAAVTGGGERIDLALVLADESRRRGSGVATWALRADAADWTRLGRDYMQRAKVWRGPAHFTDKTLLNWRFVGAAAAMLPAARFVICRRDLVATCLSCFRHLFGQDHAYTCNLEELAAFARDERRLTSLWLRERPDRTHLFEHERLLAEPEQSIRALLDFCALPFDAACLDFHENPRAVRTASVTQVRRPLQRGASLVDAYASALEPLRELLQADDAGSVTTTRTPT